jgi:hypothetical protein
VAAPSAQAVSEVYPIGLQVRGPVPAGLNGILVTTTCRATSPGGVVTQDATSVFAPSGGTFSQIFDSTLTECSVRTSMGPRSIATSVQPTVQLFRENGMRLTSFPTANPGEFQSELFTRTSTTTLQVRWEFPSFQVDKVVEGIAELSPGFAYQFAAICMNGADTVLTTAGEAQLSFHSGKTRREPSRLLIFPPSEQHLFALSQRQTVAA